MSRKKALALAFVAAFLAADAHAATYEIDAAHSSVEFKVKHLVGRVKGRFQKFNGTIEYDENNVAASKVALQIEPATIDTNNASRDNHLKGPDFFDAEKYPEMRFVSKSIDPGAQTITGDLTIHGVTKEITAKYEMTGLEADKKGLRHLGGTGRAKINRQELGIKYDPTGVTIGNDVDVEIEIEAIEKK